MGARCGRAFSNHVHNGKNREFKAGIYAVLTAAYIVPTGVLQVVAAGITHNRGRGGQEKALGFNRPGTHHTGM